MKNSWYHLWGTQRVMPETHEEAESYTPISKDLEKNLSKLQVLFEGSSDVVIHRFDAAGTKAALVYVDGLINRDLIDRDAVRPMMSGDVSLPPQRRMNVAEYKSVKTLEEFVQSFLAPNTGLLIEGSNEGYSIESKGFDRRGISEPSGEEVLRGPREGFVENIRNNTAMLRRKLKTPELVIESMVVGRKSKTYLAIAYLRSVVNIDVLDKIKSRIEQIDIDGIFETGYIEQLTEESAWSPFASYFVTEKPDVVAGKLLEGRIAVLCDGSPHVITAPYLFIENLQVSEDYYNRTLHTAMLRIIRVVSLLMTVILPGFYVSLATFNSEMIPTVLLLGMVEERTHVPLPLGLEMFVMLFLFEVIKESGLRLPKPIGSAISIVGGLIVGQTAVLAGFVSTPTVIIVALTAVTAFTVPSLSESILFFRLLFLIAGSFFGIIGILCVTVCTYAYMANIKRFGVPFLTRVIPVYQGEQQDTFLRAPLQKLRVRPRDIVKENVTRQKK